MKNKSRGFSLIEIMGALAIGSMMLISLNAMIDSAMEDSKGQQAALYQRQLVIAVNKYMNNFQRYDDLQKKTAKGVVALDISELLKEHLPTNFARENNYQHRSCILIKRRNAAPGKLDVLVLGNGGMPIAEKEIAAVAAMAGPGNGYILGDRAKGSSWELSATELATFNAVQCPGQRPATAGHLASALFFDGPGQLSTDFLYRNAVPGRPELNKINTELTVKNATFRLDLQIRREVGSSDELCSINNPDSPGRVALDSLGGVVSCQKGKWARSGYWKDPVADYEALPAYDNEAGDVRMVLDLSRAFTWDGTQWRALAVDKNGNLTLPGRVNSGDSFLSRVVAADTACGRDDPDGTMARDKDGLILSCQNRYWQSQTSMTQKASDVGCEVIKGSSVPVPAPDCSNPYRGEYTWRPEVAVWEAKIRRIVTPTKNGLINVNVWMRMNRDLADRPDNEVTGQARLLVAIRDNDIDTDNLVGSTSAESVRLINSSATINATLSKVVKRNRRGYTVEITPIWTTGQGPDAAFDRANYRTYNGLLVEQVPLSVGWNMDLFQ